MGTVYLGRHGTRWAAVKVISPGLAEDPEFRTRFHREIDVGRRVGGPYVAELYNADPDAPQPWMATRYVPGLTLERSIARHGPLTGPAIERFATAMAEALAQVHAAGIIHRDLKPSNVIITESNPVLIDFGIASAADATALTATGMTIGSYGWMAPEQILGRDATPATDVFAWGALLAYASSGVPPYGTGRPESLAYRIVHSVPDLSDVPDWYRPIVAAAMASDPMHRPTVPLLLAALAGEPSATRALTVRTTALEASSSSEPTVPVTEVEPGDPAATGMRWIVPAIVIAAVAIFGLAVAGYLIGTRGRGSAVRADDGANVALTTTTTTETTTTTTESPTTTTEPPPPTTEPPPPTTEPPPPPPPDPNHYEAVIEPLTEDIHDLRRFVNDRNQDVVTLDLRFDESFEGSFLLVDPDFDVSLALLFVCAFEAPEGPDLCWDGVEVLVHDLDTVPDASLHREHGLLRLRGRFAVQGFAGPNQGIYSVSLRAVPIA